MTLGHRVAVLRNARLQQCDTPRALFDHPVNTFVAGFVGSPAMNLCRLLLGDDGSASFGDLPLALPGVRANGRTEVTVGLRRAPERGAQVRLRPSAEHAPHVFDAETGERIGA
jgi:multiple sugar transport system ATP-binding protein